MNSPLRGRPLAFAVIALMALVLSLIAPRPTGFEWTAFAIGLLSAVTFWIQCFDFGEIPK
jgi:lipopolysaccharide export LptBFGC system permease protein LptF